MSCHGEEKCVSYKYNNTVKEVVKHEFLPPLQCHVPSHKYEHTDASLSIHSVQSILWWIQECSEM